MSIDSFKCFLCSVIVKGNYSQLTSNLKLFHGFLKTTGHSNRTLYCGNADCKAGLNSFAKYRDHVINCLVKDPQPDVRQVLPDVSFQHIEPGVTDFDVSDPLQQDSFHQANATADKTTQRLARFFLELRAKHNVSHSAIDFIAKNIDTIFKDVAQFCDLETNLTLTNIEKATSKLNSHQKRIRYFTSNMGFVEPVAKCVGHNNQPELTVNSRGETQPRKNTFQCISIRKTLSRLFSNAEFYNKYFSESPSTDGFLSGHRDSSHFRNHKLFSKVKNALRLQIFFDECESTNPLGSKTKKHELGMFNFKILNLPECENSLLSNIHCFAVCNSKDLKDSEFRFVIDEFMKEIKLLESDEGMLLDIPSKPGFRLRGAVVNVCADSKGAHQLFGFAGTSSAKFCRLCLISRSDLIKNCKVGILRTKENYNAAIEEAKISKDNIPLSGVQFDSPLNQCRYLHVAEHTVLDCMHDFLEGIVPFIIKLVLFVYVTNSHYKITADLLNSRLQRFAFSFYDQSNKPSPKFKTNLLRKKGNYNTKQRASQNWCLIRMLPLLIGDLIPEGDEYFSLILILLEIMDIVFAPSVSIEQTIILEDLINQMYSRFHSLFPLTRPINKFHHMAHYPAAIRTYGPAVGYWCMRYEAYHNSCKRVAHINCNFINIPKSVAYHLQTISCHNLLTNDLFHDDIPTVGPRSKKNLVNRQEDSITDGNSSLNLDSNATVIRWIKFKGWHYRPGTVILLKHSFENLSGYPEFGKIIKILSGGQAIYFVVTVLETITFNRHFHAFELQPYFPAKSIMIAHDNLRPNVAPTWLLKV